MMNAPAPAGRDEPRIYALHRVRSNSTPSRRLILDDLRTFKDILSDSLDRLQSEVLSEVEGARSDLEWSRFNLE